MTREEFVTRGNAEHEEFRKFFEGKRWDDIEDIVNENDLSYGALSPWDNYGIVDINYKHILATIHKVGNEICVNDICEIYDDNDELVC